MIDAMTRHIAEMIAGAMKVDLQSLSSVKAVPIIGANTGPMTPIAVTTVIIEPILEGSKQSLINAMDTTMAPPPPIACTILRTIITMMSSVNAHSTDIIM